MRIRLYLDPETRHPHIYNHDVDEAEVTQYGSRVAVGPTAHGRLLRIIYVAEPGGVFVITAYELRGKPLLAYRRRRRRKRG
jgi:hypothetical protein